MDFVLKLLVVITSFSLVLSRQTTNILKSFKLNEKMIYDCVDIYKQPSLNHPLLQTHKIQMEPSFAIDKSKIKVDIKTSKNLIDCPNGTVPILRNTKEYVTNISCFSKNHFNPLTVESHGTHFAGIRMTGQNLSYHGLASWFSVHNLNISRDQISYALIFVGSRVNNQDYYIQTGWMINPTLFGDGRPWAYGFWKGINGSGCYNTMCSGFIQVSKTDPLSKPVSEAPEGERNIGTSIQQDKISKNWWVSEVKYQHLETSIGYWPNELFEVIRDGVNMIGVGGAVESFSSGISPPMGNGHLPSKDEMTAARVYNMFYVNSNYKFKEVDKSAKIEKLLDSKKCYGIKQGKDITQILFTYGGPGGNSCGI